MALAGEPVLTLKKEDAANRAAIKLGYARGLKKEQLKLWWHFYRERMFLPCSPQDLGKACVLHAYHLHLNYCKNLNGGQL